MSNDPRPCVPGPPLKTNNGHLCLVQNKCCAIIYVPAVYKVNTTWPSKVNGITLSKKTEIYGSSKSVANRGGKCQHENSSHRDNDISKF